MSVKPPVAVAHEAEKGLALRASLPASQRCCTAVGIRRASQLKNRQPVSVATLKRMKAYFDRHQVDKRAKRWGIDSKGYQAWLLWGGDAGYAWAKRQLARLQPNPDIEDHPAFKAAERRRAALDRILTMAPHALKAPVLGGRYTVLVHKSTRKPGWWQATFFDAEGPYGDSESSGWHKLLEHIHGDSVDWEKAEPALSSAVPNPGHVEAVGAMLEQAGRASYDDFEAYFPKSASGALDDEADQFVGRDVVWIGTEGKMLPVGPDYVQHIWGNIFDPDKLAAVVAGIREHEARVHFYAPYGTASRIDRHRIKESFEYWQDEGLDRPYTTGDEYLDEYLADPDKHLSFFGEPGEESYEQEREEMETALAEAETDGEGDFGQWVVTIRDGNHRAFGALLAGEPYVYVRLADNQYQDLKQAHAKECQLAGSMNDKEKALWHMLE